MKRAERATRRDHLDTAARILEARGPTRSWPDLSVGAVCRQAGISRSTLYRTWPSMVELADDLSIHAATAHPCWLQALLATPPGDGVGTAVSRSLRTDPLRACISARFSAASFPAGHALRTAVAEWDARYLADLGSWLERALPACGRSPVEGVASIDLALVLAGLVDGWLLVRASTHPPGTSVLPRGDAALLGQLVDALVELLSVPTATAAAQPAQPVTAVTPDGTSRRAAVLEAVVTGDQTAPPTAGSSLARLCDLGVLARACGVSQRRLHMLWPSVSAANADLVEHVFAGMRATIDQHTMDAVSRSLRPDVERFRDVFVPVLDSIVRGLCDPSSSGFFACFFPWSDSVVHAVVARHTATWMESQRLMLLALLQAAGHHLRDAVDAEIYTHAVFATTVGCARIAALRPEELERTVSLDGVARPAIPSLIDAVFRSMTVVCDQQHGGPVS